MIFKQKIEWVIFDIELGWHLKCQPGRDARKVRTFQAKKKKKTLWAEEEKKTSSIRKTKRTSDGNVTIYGRLMENKDKNIAAMSQCIV